MSQTKLNTKSKIKANPNCNLCQGTGIAEYFDMSRMPEVGAGTYTLGYLCKHFGGKDICPNCFPYEPNNN